MSLLHLCLLCIIWTGNVAPNRIQALVIQKHLLLCTYHQSITSHQQVPTLDRPILQNSGQRTKSSPLLVTLFHIQSICFCWTWLQRIYRVVGGLAKRHISKSLFREGATNRCCDVALQTLARSQGTSCGTLPTPVSSVIRRARKRAVTSLVDYFRRTKTSSWII